MTARTTDWSTDYCADIVEAALGTATLRSFVLRRSICLGVVAIVWIFATMTTYEARQERASVTVHDIADNLYMLANAPSVSGMGGGGNTVIFVTDNGVALVDTKIKGYGTSRWDPDAFLLPGVNLAFDRVQYDNFSVVVRAGSSVASSDGCADAVIRSSAATSRTGVLRK